MTDFGVGIIGIGSYFPKKIVTNKDLEKTIDTTDEWITQKIGIKRRRSADDCQALSDICIPAAKKALRDANINPKKIDIIIVGAMSHDFPQGVLTGNIIKKAIGAENAYAIDINIICAGFIYCTEIAYSLIASGRAKNILVVNGEVFSKYPKTRVTSVIFGDGAGAAVFSKVKKGRGLLSSCLFSSVDGSENLGIFVGGSKRPFNLQNMDDYKIQMNGRAIYDFAVTSFKDAVLEALDKAHLSISDVDYIFSHQANINIIKEGMAELGLPMDRTVTNIRNYGNIGGGSLITVLDEAERKKILKKDKIIVNVAFGAGLAWGAHVMRWC